MAIEFSDTTNNDGIVQQTRIMCRVDSNQWPTQRIVNSCNNWLDFLTGYAIGADTRFRFDDSNHTKLPEGTTDLVLSQTDYSFLADEQGNKILTLTALSLVNSSGIEFPLRAVDPSDPYFDLSTFGKSSGTPTEYDKIADNIIRLDKKPAASDVTDYDLKFRFQRSPSYFTASDTTKTPGFAPVLHRGFIIASAYDCAMTFGLENLQVLSIELQKEQDKAVQYFENRNEDEEMIFAPSPNLQGPMTTYF